MEPICGGETKILHQVAMGNRGRIRMWPSALREELIPSIGAQLEDKNLKRGEGIKLCQSKRKKKNEALSLRRRLGMEMIAEFKCENCCHSERQMWFL